MSHEASSGTSLDRVPDTRVLIVGSGTRFVSGLSYYTVDLANALSECCHVSVVLMRRLLPRCLYPGAKRVGAPLSEVEYQPGIRVLDGVDWYWIPSIFRALRFVRREPPDWVLLQWWTGTVLHTYLVLSLMARLCRARVVIEFHEVLDTAEERVPLARHYVAVLARLLVYLSAGFVVHSAEDKAVLEKRYKIRGRPIRLIPHGPYTSRLIPRNGRVLRDAPDGICNLLFFGTIRPYKGLEHAIRAFDSLPPEDAERYWLTVVGETWEGWTLPATLIAQSRYRHRITFVNEYVHDSDAAAFFEGADAVVLPYLRSSASGPLQMAMSAGRPVIVSSVGGLPAAAEAYEGAVLVPPADPLAIREAFDRAADMMGARFADPHSWSRTVAKLAGVFDDIEARCRRRQYVVKRLAPAPTVSVVICSYSCDRWEHLHAAVESVCRQTRSPVDVIVVIDHNPELVEMAEEKLDGVLVVENEWGRGVSGARNTGLRNAGGEVVAFLDDDAIADNTWLEELSSAYRDPDVIGVGGVARPRWASGAAPRWFPREFYWIVGCEYRGLSTTLMEVRNPIGTTMSFRRAVLERIGGFSNSVGRVGSTPLGGDETELAIRARQACPQGVVLHVPTVRVEHFVSTERSRWRYFRSRCWQEGHSKALIARQVGTRDALSEEWRYALRTLPRGVMRGVRESLRMDPSGLQRCGAILVGFAITTAGYLQARLAARR